MANRRPKNKLSNLRGHPRPPFKPFSGTYVENSYFDQDNLTREIVDIGTSEIDIEDTGKNPNSP